VVGIVEKAGSMVTNRKPGQRVGVGWHGGHCNQCSACRRGEFGTCEKSLTTKSHLDGGYAEYMIARPEAIVIFQMNLTQLKLLPCYVQGEQHSERLKLSGAQGGDLVAIYGLED